ncbi:hypothetical protein GCM10009798_34890 [Nocardioides panacihumi]|uniref:DUF1345 domain-containing protein n=1 Tax=Nocardioides panacihumi TaxID=400774 RepID=A0ABP5CZZ2_9ACTN
MVTALLAAICLTVLLPHELRFAPRFLVPGLELALLLALILGDPGRIDRRTRWIRYASLTLVTVLILGALWATGLLIHELIEGKSAVANDASKLLETGAVVWASNNIAFSLFYWDLDGGGSAARLYLAPRYPDLAFPQQLSPEIAPPRWRPLFVDYLYLSFTNATAFSPTDVMPLAPWAKVAMSVQSLVSLAILGLVIARAVNVFS